MNKKGVFLAIFSLLFVLGLTTVYLVVYKGTTEVVRMYYKPTDVLNQNFEIKEYLFNLEQGIKFDTFKAFEHFCENSGLRAGSGHEAWYEDGDFDLEENFKSYFAKPNYIVSVELTGHKFKVSYVYDGKKVFEEFGVKSELEPRAEYVLDYDVSVIKELYEKCRDVVSCDELDDCKIDKDKCDDSSDINYIKMEFGFKSNDFIEPKLRFNIPKTEEL